MARSPPRSFGWIRIVMYAFLLLLAVLPQNVYADEDADAEYVRQVLEEEQEHNDDNPYDNPYSTDEDFQRYQDEAEKRAREEEERKKRLDEEATERRAREREAAFERQVQKLDEEAQKKARQKKRQDSKLVSRLLKANKRQDFYTVLGLEKQHLVSLWVPQWLLRFRPALGQIAAGDIKKAYRSMATRVHPDKNHDGRAEEAFVALDEAYSLLSDAKQREEYDRVWAAQSYQRWHSRQGEVMKVVQGTQKLVANTVRVVRKVVGPFAVPLGILGIVFL